MESSTTTSTGVGEIGRANQHGNDRRELQKSKLEIQGEKVVSHMAMGHGKAWHGNELAALELRGAELD